MYLMSKSTLAYVECPYSDVLDLHPNGQKTRFLFARFFLLVEEIENWNVMRADKVMRLIFKLETAILNDPLVVSQFIETMELLRVQHLSGMSKVKMIFSTPFRVLKKDKER
jgi:hypothetical protein